MITAIYHKIAQDTLGPVPVDAYAQFVRQELTRCYPEATITIETTTRESGVMPTVVDADTWDEEQEVILELHTIWERYCGQEPT